jgi:pimeloyl-ACP methyl ester carboxylesterase
VATATVNGAELYYEERGSGDPILLIHGNGANTRIWGDLPERLATDHRVIAYDRRGFTRSSGPLAGHLRDHADDAAALLQLLDSAPARVLGWSAGGVVSLVLAAEHPDVVSSLVLEEAALHLIHHPSAAALAAAVRIEFRRRIKRDPRGAAHAMEHWALRYTTGGSAFDRFPEDWQQSMLETPDAVVREIDQLTRLYPSRRQVASISCPVTCILGGASEPAFHRAAREVGRILPAAELVEIEGASHAIHFDRPDEFLAAVRAAAA